MGASVAMGPKMRLESMTTVPSIFAAGGDGVFNYSAIDYNEDQLFAKGIGSASDVVVRPHTLQTMTRIVGDVNGSNSLNVQDVVIMLNSIVGNIPPITDMCADANSDGLINIQDAVMLLNMIVGNVALAQCDA